MEKTAREEQKNFALFLRQQMAEEMLALENFRKAIQRKRIICGCIKMEFLDGSVAEYDFRPTDDPQTALDFVQAVCYKRTTDLQKSLKFFDPQKDK
jgi:hypothetical protein